MARVKRLGPGPPSLESINNRDITWKSVEGLTHVVFDMHGSVLTTRCMIPDLKKWDPSGYVYPARSSSYLDHELGLVWLQPITCLWCATGQWRP